MAEQGPSHNRRVLDIKVQGTRNPSSASIDLSEVLSCPVVEPVWHTYRRLAMDRSAATTIG